jgi:anti-anti-sigma factor
MALEFTITPETPAGNPNIGILHLSGWLDAQSETRLVEAVQKAKDGGAQYVLLELGGVDTMTSAGIRAIQKSWQILMPKEAAGQPARLKLCGASPRIFEVLSITGLLINMPMYESVDVAVYSFGK